MSRRGGGSYYPVAELLPLDRELKDGIEDDAVRRQVELRGIYTASASAYTPNSAHLLCF